MSTDTADVSGLRYVSAVPANGTRRRCRRTSATANTISTRMLVLTSRK
jgi:hypothetical protein